MRGVELALEARIIAFEEGAQHAECLVEAPAPLVEGNADGGVVGGRRARADSDDQTTLRQHVDRRERLRELHRPPDDRQADGGRERETARFFDHCGQRRRAVQPRPAEEQMVVGAEVAVAEGRRSPRVLLEATQGRTRSEVDQRQVGAEFHGSRLTVGWVQILVAGGLIPAVAAGLCDPSAVYILRAGLVPR